MKNFHPSVRQWTLSFLAVDGKVETGWDGYVAAHNACAADPTTCPYYSIGVYDLFDVQMDSEGIIVMTEHYSP